MATITESVEIARRAEDVFAYLDELERHGEWQESIVSARKQSEGPPAVGTRVAETRKVGGREQTMTYEITEHDPPRSFAFRILDGPVRVAGRGTVEPVGEGERARVTISLEFSGHGIGGKVLLPLAVMQARKQVPMDQQRLKERLESGQA